MNLFVFSSAKVTTKKEGLDPFKKRRIGRHHVFKLAVFGTGLSHQNLAIVFNDLRFDFALDARCIRVSSATSPVITALRTSFTQVGQRLSVSRGNPSGGALRS
jgi:hypothetical protein